MRLGDDHIHITKRRYLTDFYSSSYVQESLLLQAEKLLKPPLNSPLIRQRKHLRVYRIGQVPRPGYV